MTDPVRLCALCAYELSPPNSMVQGYVERRVSAHMEQCECSPTCTVTYEVPARVERDYLKPGQADKVLLDAVWCQRRAVTAAGHEMPLRAITSHKGTWVCGLHLWELMKHGPA